MIVAIAALGAAAVTWIASRAYYLWLSTRVFDQIRGDHAAELKARDALLDELRRELTAEIAFVGEKMAGLEICP